MHQEPYQKTIVILRGLPGSGRTIKARAMLEESRGNGVIISAADYFRTTSCSGYKYVFNPLEFHMAHMWARERALQAIEYGLDPVIINNPNMPLWHMYPYVLMAFNRGYWVIFEEMPNTWKLPLEELHRRSRRSVPLHVMDRMKRSYQRVKHIYNILFDSESISRWDNTHEMTKKDW